MRIRDWSSDVCSSDLLLFLFAELARRFRLALRRAALLLRRHQGLAAGQPDSGTPKAGHRCHRGRLYGAALRLFPVLVAKDRRRDAAGAAETGNRARRICRKAADHSASIPDISVPAGIVRANTARLKRKSYRGDSAPTLTCGSEALE